MMLVIKSPLLFIFLLLIILVSSMSRNEGLRGKRNLIVGGTEVNEGHYHYLAYLEVVGKEDDYFCGGTLVHREWVLTSAQCVTDADEITVILGAHNVKDACDQESVECHSIDVEKDVHIFPEYDPDFLQADFSLIHLAHHSHKETALINADYEQPEVDSKVWMAGWGATSDSTTHSSVPMEIEATVVSHRDCEKERDDDIVPDLQCAQGEGSFNTCYGDSGGPVIIKAPEDDDDAKDILVGVISWGFSPECPASVRPTVYGRVASILSWIKTVAPEIDI